MPFERKLRTMPPQYDAIVACTAAERTALLDALDGEQRAHTRDRGSAPNYFGAT